LKGHRSQAQRSAPWGLRSHHDQALKGLDTTLAGLEYSTPSGLGTFFPQNQGVALGVALGFLIWALQALNKRFVHLSDPSEAERKK
jgi:hypothetical protein